MARFPITYIHPQPVPRVLPAIPDTKLRILVGDTFKVLVQDPNGDWIPGDAGINHDMIVPDLGLPVELNYNRKREGDVVAVRWKNGPVSGDLSEYTRVHRYIVKASDVNMDDEVLNNAHPLVLYLTEGVPQPAQAAFFFEVTRPGDNETPSAIATALIKLSRPGGTDEDPLPGHQNLKAPVVPKPVFDKLEDVVLQIEAYPHIRVRDVVVITWGGVPTEFTLTAEQAQPGGTLTFVIPKDVLELAGDAERLEVVYRVRDEVYNHSEDSSGRRWSMPTWVEVDANDNPLSALWIEEAESGQLGEFRLHLDSLGGNPATAGIMVDGVYVRLGDTIELTLRGTTRDGAAVLEHYYDDVKVVGRPMTFKIPYEVLARLAQSSAAVYYTVVARVPGQRGRVRKAWRAWMAALADDVPPIRSKRITLRVDGEVVDLAAPVVVDGPGGQLPIDAPARIDVLPYVPMHEGDLVMLTWTGTSASGQPVLRQIEHTLSKNEENTVLRFEVETLYVNQLDGRLATVSYTVTAGGARRQSDVAVVRVGTWQALYPAPTLPEAQDGVLLPENVPAEGALLVLPAAVQVVPGDVVYYHWQGSIAGVYGDRKIVDETAEKPEFRIAKAQVEANLGGTATVNYSIQRGATFIGLSADLSVQVGKQTAIELPPPRVEHLSANGELKPGDVPRGTQVTVAFDDMLLDDQIALFWTGTEGDGTPPLEWQSGNEAKTVVFQISAKAIAANLNHGVQVMYALIRGSTVINSPVVAVQVLDFAPGDLPTPLMPDAVGDVLDVLGLTADADVRIPVWPLIGVGQKVWLKLVGQNLDGSALTLTLATGAAVSASETTAGFVRTASRTQLQQLKDGTTLRVEAKVSVDTSANANEAEAKVLPVKSYTVKTIALIQPLITSVKDPANNEIPQNSATFATSVTVTGTATASQQVDIFDQGVNKGSAPVNAAGIWSLQVSSLATGAHALTAVASYDPSLVSPARTFTTLADVRPTITSVQGASGNVGNGGTTKDTALTLRGNAAPNLQVRVEDNGVNQGTVTANSNGIWTHPVTSLSAGSHRFTATALYGSELESTAWNVTVNVTPPLVINTTRMVLSGVAMNIPSFWGWTRTGQDSIGNTETRTASGGTPPYSYRASNSDYISVSGSGKVTGLRNGSARVTVTDNAGASASYEVQVSNVWQLEINTARTADQAIAWANSIGASAFSAEMVDDVNRTYNVPSIAAEHISWACGGSWDPVYPYTILVQRTYGTLVHWKAGDGATNKTVWAALPR